MLYVIIAGLVAIVIIAILLEKQLYFNNRAHYKRVVAIERLINKRKEQQVKLQYKVDATEALTKGKHKDMYQLIMMICFFRGRI